MVFLGMVIMWKLWVWFWMCNSWLMFLFVVILFCMMLVWIWLVMYCLCIVLWNFVIFMFMLCMVEIKWLWLNWFLIWNCGIWVIRVLIFVLFRVRFWLLVFWISICCWISDFSMFWWIWFLFNRDGFGFFMCDRWCWFFIWIRCRNLCLVMFLLFIVVIFGLLVKLLMMVFIF